MRPLSLALVPLCATAACAPLQSTPLPEVGPPEFARVLAQRTLDMRAGETKAERAAWAMLSLNPVVVATAVMAVEDEHGRSQISEYDLALEGGGALTVQSRYLVQPGQCVMMRRPVGEGFVVIVAEEDSRCAAISAGSE